MHTVPGLARYQYCRDQPGSVAWLFLQLELDDLLKIYLLKIMFFPGKLIKYRGVPLCTPDNLSWSGPPEFQTVNLSPSIHQA
jgi:hypothetical protein